MTRRRHSDARARFAPNPLRKTRTSSSEDTGGQLNLTDVRKVPYWPDALLLKIIQPAAIRAGITKRIDWHTFRHSYSSLLVANGENVKVAQELMRHTSSRFALDVYSQAEGSEETRPTTGRPFDPPRDIR